MATVDFDKRNKPTTIIIVCCLGPRTHMCSSMPYAHSGGGHAIRRSRCAITGKHTNYGRNESWRQTLARACALPETQARSERRRRCTRWSWTTISWTITVCGSSRLRCRKRAWRRSKPMTHNYTHSPLRNTQAPSRPGTRAAAARATQTKQNQQLKQQV